MKTHFCHIGFMLAVLTQVSSCQQIAEKKYSLKVQAVDIYGNPAKGITVVTGRIEPMVSPQITLGKPVTTDPVMTDEQGGAVIRFKSLPEPSGNVNFYHDGWYSTSAYAIWEDANEHGEKLRRAEIKAVLKPIKNPIPMVFHSSAGLHLREIGEEYALDLELGEMLPPHGIGKVPDMLVTLKGQRIDNGPDQEEDIDFKASIRFSNPLDGLIEFEIQPKDGAKGSAFSSDYLAPEDGYLSSLERIAVQGKFLIPDRNAPHLLQLDRKAYYFRVRTKTDGSGRIVSSNFGKIYGPISLRAGRKRKVFHPTILEAGLSINDIYFNPNLNDRNVECDVSRNLSKKTDKYGKQIRIDRP